MASSSAALIIVLHVPQTLHHPPGPVPALAVTESHVAARAIQQSCAGSRRRFEGGAELITHHTDTNFNFNCS